MKPSEANAVETRPRIISERTENTIDDRHQYSEILANAQSNFDITTNGSRIVTKDPPNDSSKKKSPPRTSKASLHFLEKNKKLVETPVHIRLSKDSNT